MSFGNGQAVLQSPPSSGWTWANQNSSTTTTTGNNKIYILTPKSGSPGTHALSMYYQTAPSTPYRLIVKLTDNQPNKNGSTGDMYNAASVGFFDGSSNFVGITRNYNFGGAQAKGITVSYYNSTSNLSSNLFSYINQAGIYDYSRAEWFMIRDDGSGIYFYISNNGFDWAIMYSESRTAHLSSPAKVGVWADPEGREDANYTIDSWYVLPL